MGQQNLFVKMKRRRMERRQGWDTAKQHRLNTEHRAVITVLVIPALILQEEKLVCKAHAGGAMICFSRRFKLQLTADRTSVYSSFFERVHQSSNYWRDVRRNLYLNRFSWYTAVSHPNHRSRLNYKEGNSCKHCVGEVGRRLDPERRRCYDLFLVEYG